MSLKISEADVRDEVIAYFNKLGGALHIRNVFRAGVKVGFPDDTFYFCHRTLHIEFKAPGKRPSRKQEHIIAILRDAGHAVLIIDNAAEGKRALDYVTEGNWEAVSLEKHVAKSLDREYRGLVESCRRLDAW